VSVHVSPQPPRPGQPKKRGPKPTYGKQALSLAKRAASRGGWQTEQLTLYGKEVTKAYKTFLATYKVAYGLIRVVLVKEADHWEAFFCTDPQASVAQVLEAYADRAAIEQGFKGPERGARGEPAAGAQLLGERRGVPPGVAVAHPDRAMGVGPAAGAAERP
jgi:hypothetical protein